MRTAFYYASAVLLGLVFGIVGVLYLERVRNTAVPIPPMPIETEQVAPQPPLPPSLDDIQVTVIRVGSDVTLLLDWKPNTTSIPFHIWVEVDGSNVVLNSPNTDSRTIEVVLETELVFFGSTLYHEHNTNRLAIDLQVKNPDEKEQPQ